MLHSPFYTKEEIGKGFDFSPWGGIEGFLKATSNGATAGGRGVALKRVVPDLSRAVDMTATAIAGLPFDVVNDGGDIIDTSADWKNELGGIPDPKRLFYLIASALCGGAAYIIPQRTPRYIYDLQYAVPHSITPQISMNGLEYFDRVTDQGKADKYYPKQIIYFWLPDSDVEIGPALNSPLSNAMTDAELILNATNTMRIYGERGFVPLMVLGAKGMPNPTDRQSAEGFFDRLLRGGFDVLAKIINSEALSVIKIGAGFEELKGAYVEMKRESSESIAKSFGIPSAMFMSDNAFASEFDALTRQWYTTSRFRSIYQTIEGTMNTQLFKQYGVKMVYHLEEMDIFQEDESQRASSLSSLVTAIDKNPKIAKLGMAILGYDMTDEEMSELDAVIKEKEEAQEEMKEKTDPASTDGTETKPVEDEQIDEEEQEDEEVDEPVAKAIHLSTDEIKDLALWCSKAVTWVAKGKSAVDWENKHLREAVAAPIRAKLATATTETEIKKAFEISETVTVAPAYRSEIIALADAINKAADVRMEEPKVFNFYNPPINLTNQIPEQGVTVNVPTQPVPTIENKVSVNVPEQPSVVNVNIPEQPAPVVNVAAPNVTVNNEPAVNNIEVKPADVNLPSFPKEATITNDGNGSRTLRVKK